jgi:hypothetical protein
LALWLAFAGTLGIFGGELLCLFGPLQYQRLVHIVCHGILYSGVALVAVAAGLRVADVLRLRR